MGELEHLRQLRSLINKRIKEITPQQEKSASRGRNSWLANGRSDCIASKELRPYVRDWIDRGYPLNKLAEQAHVSDKTLRTILNGESMWTQIPVAERILDALDLQHISYILMGDNYEAVELGTDGMSTTVPDDNLEA